MSFVVQYQMQAKKLFYIFKKYESVYDLLVFEFESG